MSENRFDAVRELVKDPSLKVTEIAWKTGYNKGHVSRLRKEAMLQAIEQARKREPVAWVSISPTNKNGKRLHWTKAEAWRWSSKITPLYGDPPKQWVALTDEEVSEVIDNVLEGGGWLDVARALEAAIKRKNA